MLLAQISDLHVMPKGQLAYGRVDTAPMLRDAIEHLNRLDPQPDAVLITGDLAHFHENYDSDGVPGFNFDRAETIASLERIKGIAKNLKATSTKRQQEAPRRAFRLDSVLAARRTSGLLWPGAGHPGGGGK